MYCLKLWLACVYLQVPFSSLTLCVSCSLAFPRCSWSWQWDSTPVRAWWQHGGRYARCSRVKQGWKWQMTLVYVSWNRKFNASLKSDHKYADLNKNGIYFRTFCRWIIIQRLHWKYKEKMFMDVQELLKLQRKTETVWVTDICFLQGWGLQPKWFWSTRLSTSCQCSPGSSCTYSTPLESHFPGQPVTTRGIRVRLALQLHQIYI